MSLWRSAPSRTRKASRAGAGRRQGRLRGVMAAWGCRRRAGIRALAPTCWALHAASLGWRAWLPCGRDPPLLASLVLQPCTVTLPPFLACAGVEKANSLMRAFCYGMMGPFWDERRVHIDR